MKRILFYLGKLGCGKSYVARIDYMNSQELDDDPCFIEVSDLVTRFAKQITGKENPSREEQQAVKDQMKNDPNWLLNSITKEIDQANTKCIYVCGLREKWIFDVLETLYGSGEVIIVEADDELRRNRRGLSEEEFAEAQARDDKIGLSELLDSVTGRAKTVINNYEYTS